MKTKLFHIAAIGLLALTGATQIPVSSINGFNAAVDSRITTSGLVPPTRTMLGTSGRITGGGDLSANRTFDLASGIVTAGSAGDGTHVGAVTVDTYGRVTGLTSTAISFPTSVTGNAGTATALASARTIDTLTGDVTSSGCLFDGTAPCSSATSLAASIAGPHTFSGALTASGGVTGNVTGSVTGNVTGNVSGSSGSTTGNAATATTLASPHTISITGDIAYTSGSFNGSADVTGTGTLATVNGNTGTIGDSTHVAGFTVNSKGLITAASSIAIAFPTSTATLSTPRTIDVFTGDVTASGCSFDGSAGCSTAATLAGTIAGAHTFSGVLTASGGVTGNVTGNVSGSSGSTTGNAATATTLATSRTIDTLTGDVTTAGCSFNGSANCSSATVLASSLSGTHAFTGQVSLQATTTIFGSNTGSGLFLNLNAAAGTSRIITIQSGGLNRYQLFATATAESGSNVGSDFTWRAYADDGSTQIWNLLINRASGIWTFPSTIITSTMSPGVNTIATDTGGTYTLAATGLQTQNLTAAITANRTVTIPAAGVAGRMFHFTRDVASTGAFNWAIGALKNLAAGTWCEITDNGTVYKLTAYGSL